MNKSGGASVSVVVALSIGWATAVAAAESEGLSRWVDPLIGVVGHGACMPGPCLPHASVYPSPNTLKPKPSGFVYGDDVVGFAQLHTQGTGGTPTYGNFLVSPRLGPGVKEADLASPLADVSASCFEYRARLTRWDTRCTVAPAAHAALYRFEFPANEDARLVFNVARKIGKATALTNGEVRVDASAGAITGGGAFDGNWNPAPYRLFFCAKVDVKPAGFGVWRGAGEQDGAASAKTETREPLGAWLRFDTRQARIVNLKIAVSFTSVERAAQWLDREIPRVGQGGDEADNVIADAYVKRIPGVDWNAAWEVLAANVNRRTEDYRAKGWVAHKSKHDYCGRMKSGSGTIGFAYNDWCASQVASGLGKADEAKRLLERSRNWRNLWDASLADSGFTGFIRARNADGTFQKTEARKGYNTDFYEGTCWQYSYVLPHDVPGMIEAMGGKNLYVQSATLNGQPLNEPVIHHRDLVAGGTLAFVMGDTPSAWGCGGEFDAARAAQETGGR